MFTGREDEIEEITNLITGQSTRLLNIWGSPGFGKTSTAIEVARHLLSLDCPVYFFKLQGIRTVDEFLSKILSIFKSNLADLSLRPIDKLVSIFREISSRIFLIFDNLDDLLQGRANRFLVGGGCIPNFGPPSIPEPPLKKFFRKAKIFPENVGDGGGGGGRATMCFWKTKVPKIFREQHFSRNFQNQILHLKKILPCQGPLSAS